MPPRICFGVLLLLGSGRLWERIFECLWPPPWGCRRQKNDLFSVWMCFPPRLCFPRTSREHSRSRLVASRRFLRAFSHSPNEMFGTSDMHTEQASPLRILDMHNRISAVMLCVFRGDVMLCEPMWPWWLILSSSRLACAPYSGATCFSI